MARGGRRVTFRIVVIVLQVYDALYCLWTRNFKRAASLLIDGIATFTATELFPYSTFVLYVVLAAMVAVDRNTLRDKVRARRAMLEECATYTCFSCR